MADLLIKIVSSFHNAICERKGSETVESLLGKLRR